MIYYTDTTRIRFLRLKKNSFWYHWQFRQLIIEMGGSAVGSEALRKSQIPCQGKVRSVLRWESYHINMRFNRDVVWHVEVDQSGRSSWCLGSEDVLNKRYKLVIVEWIHFVGPFIASTLAIGEQWFCCSVWSLGEIKLPGSLRFARWNDWTKRLPTGESSFWLWSIGDEKIFFPMAIRSKAIG
jgi:hypothetical protein